MQDTRIRMCSVQMGSETSNAFHCGMAAAGQRLTEYVKDVGPP